MKRILCIFLSIAFIWLLPKSASCQIKEVKYFCPPCNNSCDSLAFSKSGICPVCKMNLLKNKPNPSSAQQKLNVSKLDSFITSLSKKDLALGSLAISKNGKLQYQRAFGYSYIDSNHKVEANNQTKYRIGSISKMFTAVMIFQLIEEGKICLDEKLDVYYPNLPNAGKITVNDLLYHRSGLHEYTKDTGFEEAKTQQDLLKIIKDRGADFEPGSKAEYCNSNYLLLGYIIEQVCRMPYPEVLKKRITSKIGLKDTYYGNSIDIGEHESASYKYSDSNWKKQKETNLSLLGGAGSIVATPSDLVKFIEDLFSYKLVSKSSLDRMKTLIDGYGMGMFPNKYGSLPSFGHNGKIEELLKELRQSFDYVLIDTPPVGLVTDAVIIGEFVDAAFYLVRHEYTPKAFLRILSDLKRSEKIKSVNVIFNGVDYKNSQEYGYGYRYGYGYGYSYTNSK